MSVSLKFINDNANFLRGAVSVPAGWVIVPDHRTGNIIVHDGERGFAVTGLCLKEWTPERIVADVNRACADLVAKGETDICSHFMLAEMPANEPKTRWDTK
jgi:hypothetical protein